MGRKDVNPALAEKAGDHSSRKFILSGVVIMIATFLLIGGVILPKDWVQVVQVIGGAYLAANVGEKVINRLSVGAGFKPAPTDGPYGEGGP